MNNGNDSTKKGIQIVIEIGKALVAIPIIFAIVIYTTLENGFITMKRKGINRNTVMLIILAILFFLFMYIGANVLTTGNLPR